MYCFWPREWPSASWSPTRSPRPPQGQQFFDDVDAKAREFGSAVVDGYKAREAELRAAVADAEDAIADLTARANKAK